MNLILALILKMALMLRVVPHEPQIGIPKQPAIVFTGPPSGFYRVETGWHLMIQGRTVF